MLIMHDCLAAGCCNLITDALKNYCVQTAHSFTLRLHRDRILLSALLFISLVTSPLIKQASAAASHLGGT